MWRFGVMHLLLPAVLAPAALAQESGSIVGWGAQIVQRTDKLTALAPGGFHSLGLREDGSIAAPGDNSNGECGVPGPNSGFVAVAAGYTHSLGPRGDAACYPDFDESGALNLFDFLAFANLFNTRDPAADCDGNNLYNLFDFLCFTNAFNAGC